jgi:RNA polymerase sigma-70 factor (ECF subfamily)
VVADEAEVTAVSQVLHRPRPQVAGKPASRQVRIDGFAEHYRQFFPRVFAYVYSRVRNATMAEDIVSEVFERALLKADSLRNDEAFGTWLFTIARNVTTSHARRRAREHCPPDPEIWSNLPSTAASVEARVLQGEEAVALMEYVRRLSQREQEIIALKFDAELTNRQIAKIVGTSEGNVRVILFRSLRKLRDIMQASEAGLRSA